MVIGATLGALAVRVGRCLIATDSVDAALLMSERVIGAIYGISELGGNLSFEYLSLRSEIVLRARTSRRAFVSEELTDSVLPVHSLVRSRQDSIFQVPSFLT